MAFAPGICNGLIPIAPMEWTFASSFSSCKCNSSNQFVVSRLWINFTPFLCWQKLAYGLVPTFNKKKSLCRLAQTFFFLLWQHLLASGHNLHPRGEVFLPLRGERESYHQTEAGFLDSLFKKPDPDVTGRHAPLPSGGESFYALFVQQCTRISPSSFSCFLL